MKLRIGLIGLGQRGMATLNRYRVIADAEIVAISDIRAEAIASARSVLGPEVLTFQGEGQWCRLCDEAQIDLVYVCTDWASHAPIAVYAMQRGKHVALEVPAAMTVSECWQLVETAEQTGRQCIMLENCCYDTFHLGIMGMAKQGLFGEIAHCEGAYIHDLRSDHGWMSYIVNGHGGNPYPTHAIGPVCQLLGVNRDDRLLTLTSVSGLNGVNNTLVRTARGRSILLQFDERTPRPYSRLQTLCGTLGFAQKYPQPVIQLEGREPLYGTDVEELLAKYREREMQALIEEGLSMGVPNLMNYVMDRRLVGALRSGRPLDMSVYDAALWSCITELSAQSASLGGQPVEIPDFTKSRWNA